MNVPVHFSTKSEVEAVEAVTKRAIVPVVLRIFGGGEAEREIVAVPPCGANGQWTLESAKDLLDDYLERPERRKGTAKLGDLQSFIAHANRFKDTGSALFADPTPTRPSLTSVLDYHQGAGGQPRFGKHRGVYEFPLSDEWKIWTGRASKPMAQAEFGEFLENYVTDVLDPAGAGPTAKDLAATIGCHFASPSKLLELSRGFSVNVGTKVRNAQNLSTGEISVQYQVEHADDAGALLKVPGAFLVGLPVFKAGAPYQLAVRLRYALRDGSVAWRFELHRADRVFDHAFNEACTKATADTDLPLFVGAPES